MFNRATKYISFRLVMILTIVATIIIVISANIIFNRSYQHELNQNQHKLSQLIKTVAHTAAISAYVVDSVLAKEVVDGLMNNDVVSAVSLNTNSKILLEKGEFTDFHQDKLIRFQLTSPFDESEIVGELIVQANNALIESSAKNMALEHVLYNAINSIILIIVLIFLLNQQLIKAVKSIASKLHTITPGSEQRLQVDSIHSKDEIGMLVSDINLLLASAESQLKQERALRCEVEVLERHFRNIFEQTSGGLALIDQSGYIQIQNPSFEKIIGIENSARLTNSPKQSLFTLFGFTDEASLSHFYQSLNAKQPFTTDIKLSHVDTETWIQCAISRVTNHGEQQLFEVLIHDISERRKREDNFKTQADHDPLTGVYNRRSGKRKVQRLLNSARESDYGFAVLMIDIDNFKPINDQYGHKTGDKVLRSLTQKILNVVRTEDIVIRWGGDEFLLIIKQKLNDAGINKVAEKLVEALRTGIEVEPQLSINIGASIGIALYPEHGQTIDVLTHYADEAMYSIKSQSKDGYAIYTHPIIDNDDVTDDEILH